MLSGYQDAETGQRGYLLTGQDEFLEPYRKGLGDVTRLENELATLTRDDTEQRRRLEELRRLGLERLTALRRTLESRRTTGSLSPETVGDLREGLSSMRRVRRAIAEIDSVEENLLDDRRLAARQSADYASQTTIFGTLAGLATLALACWWMKNTLHQQIGFTVQQLKTSSAELQVVATQQAGGAKQQATAMTEISATLNELLATARQILMTALEVSGISHQATDFTREGMDTVRDGRDAIDAIQRQFGMVVDQILELQKKSAQIGTVTKVVAELSEQTNILAINATIEAATAGELGRRFGAVADEIRRLSDRVKLSAREIGTLLEEVRDSVRGSLSATETGANSVIHGAGQFDRVVTSFQKISQSAIRSTEASLGIGLSIRQQTTATEKVSTVIAQLAEGARQSEVAATQTLQTARQLSGLAQGLQRKLSSQTNRAS